MTEIINEKLYSNASLWCFPAKHTFWTEYYITVIVDSAIETDTEAEEFFGNVFAFLNEHNIQILQEKLYALSSNHEKLVNIRSKQFKKSCPDYDLPPTTFIEGLPCKVEGTVSGMHIIGITTHTEQCNVETVKCNGEAVGKIFRNPLYKEVFLSGMSGGRGDDALITKVRKMFLRSQELLAVENLNPTDIIRTWIYFPRILDWYGEFNKGRTNWFKESGLITDSGIYLPASTGIQGKRFDDEECFMDILGLSIYDHKKVSVSVMKNIRQNEANEYGSSFSRGMSVKVEDISGLYISGTASINNKGKTVYFGDSQGQVLETFLNVAALLDTEQSKIKDIVLATAYCKNRETFNNFSNITKLLDLKDVPFLPVYADVCRNELLFETDCIAIRGKKVCK